MYLEDDQIVQWNALLSWALDAEALAPFGHQRAFFRTETARDTGEDMMLDITDQLSVRQAFTLHLDADNVTRPFCPSCRALEQHHCRHHMCVHQHYIQVPDSFQGMWLASHDLMTQFMQSLWWDKNSALKQPTGRFHDGYAERTTWGLQLFSPPACCDSAMVVPYDPDLMRFEHVARVQHMRNGYSGNAIKEKGAQEVGLGQIKFTTALQP
jgi:hypothetical protein